MIIIESINAGIWSIVPPIVAIALALITKEVVFSLIMGVLSGTIIYAVILDLGFVGVFDSTMTLMATKFGDNASMILFLCLLGVVVAIVTKAGGSKAYGDWAASKLKSKGQAGLATTALGILIFIDDYFNCLTVGTVMRPVTDRFRMSREKLAYVIDATAAPVCIIAPISSWAASVISYYPTDTGISGMAAFIKSIPMNLYAVLTLFMVIWMSVKKNADYGPMAVAEHRAETEGILTNETESIAQEELEKQNIKKGGKVYDLLIPIGVLIVLSILAMIYVGGYWSDPSVTLFQAFGDTDAGTALALGAFGTLVVMFLYFFFTKKLKFREFFDCVPTGVKNMVGACIILALAWTISGVCRDLLLTGEYVADLVKSSGMDVRLLPAIIFVVACLLSFATGTSWGTFAILIPIAIDIAAKAASDIPNMVTILLSATLAGAVFGDHCSPISDTTILASTGAGCNHLDHVATQVPYTVTVAIACFIGYIIAGFTSGLAFGITLAITLAVSFGLLLVMLLVLPKVWGKDKVKAK